MRRRVLLQLVLALTASSCGDGKSPSPPAGSVKASAEAKTAAASVSIEIVDLKGVEAALARQRGSACLVNFWATWCPPCVEELPELMEVAHAYRERGVDVLGISYDLMITGVKREQMVDKLRKFLVGKGLDLPTLIYDAPDYSTINELLDLPGPVPVTLAIDKNGTIVDRQTGPADKARFEEMMNKALGS